MSPYLFPQPYQLPSISVSDCIRSYTTISTSKFTLPGKRYCGKFLFDYLEDFDFWAIPFTMFVLIALRNSTFLVSISLCVHRCYCSRIQQLMSCISQLSQLYWLIESWKLQPTTNFPVHCTYAVVYPKLIIRIFVQRWERFRQKFSELPRLNNGLVKTIS